MDEQGLGGAIHAASHYENFPVASWLLPAAMRGPVLALYRFARAGDDLADEGDLAPAERLAGLQRLEDGLRWGGDHWPARDPGPRSGRPAEAAAAGRNDTDFLLGLKLGQTLAERAIGLAPALSLLQAFRHDVCFAPFEDWPAIDHYCSQSASPVGQLMLAFAGLDISAPPEQIPRHLMQIREASDAICRGLQLVNFAQDLHEDLRRGRPTLPRTLWPVAWQWSEHADGHRAGAAFFQYAGLSEQEQIALTTALAQRGLDLLAAGQTLPAMLRTRLPQGQLRLSLEIATTLLAGQAMAEAILRDPLTPWHRSLRLSKWQLLGMMPRAWSLTHTQP